LESHGDGGMGRKPKGKGGAGGGAEKQEGPVPERRARPAEGSGGADGVVQGVATNEKPSSPWFPQVVTGGEEGRPVGGSD